jgi:hypothetical protein
MSKYTIADGVRMVGHLLEHHPTTGFYAKNSTGGFESPDDKLATCWCFLGANSVVSIKLGLDFRELLDVTKKQTIPHATCVAGHWDNADDSTRLEIAKKLQEYGSRE